MPRETDEQYLAFILSDARCSDLAEAGQITAIDPATGLVTLTPEYSEAVKDFFAASALVGFGDDEGDDPHE